MRIYRVRYTQVATSAGNTQDVEATDYALIQLIKADSRCEICIHEIEPIRRESGNTL